MSIMNHLAAENRDAATEAAEPSKPKRAYNRRVAPVEGPLTITPGPTDMQPNHSPVPRGPITPTRPRVAMGEFVRSADEPAPIPVAAPRQRPRDLNRKPFGTHEQKMAFPERPGYHRHIFNDTPGRIERAKAAGYEHVMDSRGNPTMMVVGKDEAGKALNAYLMEMPQEWYDEDMADRQNEQERTMAAIKRGSHSAPENSYVPQKGISLERR